MTTVIPGVNAPDPTYLASANAYKTYTFTKTISLVTRMTEVLQKVAAAQADGLKLLTNWQKQYTNLMAVVPAGPYSNAPYMSASDDVTVNLRANISRVLANISSTLQSRQSTISDLAKALQSSVNQTNDAVNQQSSVGTTFLQSIQSLLGAIYK